jgi:hypothetical protein
MSRFDAEAAADFDRHALRDPSRQALIQDAQGSLGVAKLIASAAERENEVSETEGLMPKLA